MFSRLKRRAFTEKYERLWCEIRIIAEKSMPGVGSVPRVRQISRHLGLQKRRCYRLEIRRFMTEHKITGLAPRTPALMPNERT